MFASFLPPEVSELTESTSISFAERLECQEIMTSMSARPISTSFARQGSGEIPIILLHGFDSSSFEFRRLLPLLAAETETWAIDLLGFGFTERIAEIPFSPKAIKTHLYYFWKTLIEKPAIWVGVSMGGAAAIDLTLSYPEIVKKLVLIDSAGLAKPPVIGKFLFPPLDYLAVEFLRHPLVRRKISLKAYYDPKFVSPDAELCAALHLKAPRWSEALIAFTKSGGYGSFQDNLSRIEQPTLILWGKEDRILGTADALKFKQALANSKLIWIDNCGHVPHLEKPQITARHILDFIANR
ncbi:MAG: alpha/beta hydrolase [Oscillatoriaceae bacterium SKW80]|nr:alpha/beta hydrolase [Oscillatoriaceae bacterium SKYG93]MCX8119358.1 alpha/beta hydrolase [Oscillatoriaceae bacterium SKW80]MDW8454825.1 alpha/beta hydrolase [Oscillatoriaceae cyanobacterium SKYGB_i_bin93]HIK28395.1 alpha/beta hydrolase [Oscillatoriaceae cyanobacterium M7585_C2015_266]